MTIYKTTDYQHASLNTWCAKMIIWKFNYASSSFVPKNVFILVFLKISSVESSLKKLISGKNTIHHSVALLKGRRQGCGFQISLA